MALEIQGQVNSLLGNISHSVSTIASIPGNLKKEKEAEEMSGLKKKQMMAQTSKDRAIASNIRARTRQLKMAQGNEHMQDVGQQQLEQKQNFNNYIDSIGG